MLFPLQSPGPGNTLVLSSKHGQQYQCILPQLKTSEKENEENKILSKDEIPLLLEPLKKKCLYNVSLIDKPFYNPFDLLDQC